MTTLVNVRELPVMSLADAMAAADDIDGIEREIGRPFGQWYHDCHRTSLAILRTGRFGRGRIARGGCEGVTGQHSWIVLGDDCYDPDGIVDPTLWSYRADVDAIFAGYPEDYDHTPHGLGHYVMGHKPSYHGGPVLQLTPDKPLSPAAQVFLDDEVGPLDYRGWGELAHMAVRGWPAKEILTAMCQTEHMGVLIPIDIRGMVTDLNPEDLYW